MMAGYDGPIERPGRAYDYFAVNAKGPYATAYRVSGRLGECAIKHPDFHTAETICKALNRAYRLGIETGLVGIQGKSPTSHREGK